MSNLITSDVMSQMEERARQVIGESAVASPAPWFANSEKDDMWSEEQGRPYGRWFFVQFGKDTAGEEDQLRTAFIPHDDDRYGLRHRDTNLIARLRSDGPAMAADVIALVTRVKELEARLKAVQQAAG